MTIWRIPWFCYAFLILAVGIAASRADASDQTRGLYQLTAGDKISIAHSGVDDVIEAQVDIDGQVRLIDFGAISVIAMTLSEAEKAIANAIEEAGYFVEPRVDIALVEHAPIVVAGDVAEPGRHAFLPSMSVETAIALAGGNVTRGMLQSDILHRRLELKGQAHLRQIEIASRKVDIARLKATLVESLSLGLSKETEQSFDGLEGISTASDDAQRLLSAELRRAKGLLNNWDQEISALEVQRSIYADRLKVREEIAEFARSELAIAKDLQEKGLQTAARLLSVELREANARSDVLELQTAQVVAATAQAKAERERQNYITQRETRLLRELNTAKEQLAKDIADLKRLNEQISHLSDPVLSMSFLEPTYEMTFRLNRQGVDIADVELSTRVLPGDILYVDLEPLAAN